jgi:hypothetical protein
LPETTSAAALSAQKIKRISNRTRWIAVLWLVAAISVGGMAVTGPYGWDVRQCWTAIQSVGHGGSAYAGGIAALKAYEDLPSHAAGDRQPVIYIYSPLTIPVLRLLAMFPGWLLGPLYSCVAAAGFLLQLRAGYQMATEEERRWLIFLLPFAAFFPGLLSDVTIVAENIAYVLYGLILATAIPGWKRNKWTWFYVAVVAASVVKVPMLTLLAFPVLVGRRQWVQASIAGAAGSLLVVIQPLLWPAQFHEYLRAVHLAFDTMHSFGFGPAGLVGNWLWTMRRPYSLAATITYLAWAAGLGTLLLTASYHVRRNDRLRELWIPVALLGTILLDPRITFYDTAPLTIPLLLIGWRVLRLGQETVTRSRAGHASSSIQSAPLQTARSDRRNLVLILMGAGCFAACNIIDMIWGDWVPMELAVLLLIFALGIWSLYKSADDLVAENL